MHTGGFVTCVTNWQQVENLLVSTAKKGLVEFGSERINSRLVRTRRAVKVPLQSRQSCLPGLGVRVAS